MSERLEWLEWRRLGIGSSDSPALMGESPYSTALDIYYSKVNPVEEKEPNFAMQMGNTLEPIARAKYEILSDADFPPANFVHASSPHYRASLDGYNNDLNKAIEIKYCGKEFKTEIPEKYKAQLQWQYIVTLCSSLDYVQIDNMNRINVMPVERDNEYIASLVKTVEWFWDCVKNKKENEVQIYSENTYLTVDDNTYRLSDGKIKEARKLLKGVMYKLHKIHDGGFLDYNSLIANYKKEKEKVKKEKVKK